ncbi:G patch domain-containing protein 11 isoform X2 [Trichomycterus rosablanca]
MLKRVKTVLRKETKAAITQSHQKSYKEQEQERRDAALQTSISRENKGFALLQKMGYNAGQGLGKEGTGCVEPIPLNIKTDRGGIGLEEFKKRKAEEELQSYQTKVQLQQQMEKRVFNDFRERKKTEREKHHIEVDLRKSQLACEHLDSQKGIIVPGNSWHWPEVDTNEPSIDICEQEKEELTALMKLQFLTSYLRGVHFYCIWCGTAYSNDEDLQTNCPGETATDHDD